MYRKLIMLFISRDAGIQHKEDQATDRAYRIGQTKDVYVYYPTVRDPEITTFEVTLDELLKRRRALAKDMLCAAPDLSSTDFEDILKGT